MANANCLKLNPELPQKDDIEFVWQIPTESLVEEQFTLSHFEFIAALSPESIMVHVSRCKTFVLIEGTEAADVAKIHVMVSSLYDEEVIQVLYKSLMQGLESSFKQNSLQHRYYSNLEQVLQHRHARCATFYQLHGSHQLFGNPAHTSEDFFNCPKKRRYPGANDM